MVKQKINKYKGGSKMTQRVETVNKYLHLNKTKTVAHHR